MGDDDVPEPATVKQYTRWKTLIPFLYDWFNNHNLTPWPSYTCRYVLTITRVANLIFVVDGA
jgi:hypothetical protein